MSETVDIQTKPTSVRENSKDKRTLDQVEKWMEMIREISGMSSSAMPSG